MEYSSFNTGDNKYKFIQLIFKRYKVSSFVTMSYILSTLELY